MIYTVDTDQKAISFKESTPFKAIVETVENVFGSDNTVQVYICGEKFDLAECRRMAGTIKNPRQSNVK